MVILALGPTATVLASALADCGVQALDIGHIDIEYEWFLKGTKTRVAVSGKYTNEVFKGNEVEDCKDSRYLSQIIERIGC